MYIDTLRDSSIQELNQRATGVIAACGYESRASAITKYVTPHLRKRIAVCFSEWPKELSRTSNERAFREAGFTLETVDGNDSDGMLGVFTRTMLSSPGEASIAIDVSSMTRAWHGSIVRALKALDSHQRVETFFTYTPARFSSPPRHTPLYEVVAPVSGFASLSPPDLPIAAVIGLGYEKERALGLQQLLDPKRTILLIPRFRTRLDEYYPEVLRSNKDIRRRTPTELQFEYWLDEPSSTFGLLSSLVSSLLPSYRIVLASIGPKMLGILFFLLTAKFPQVSVWRASSGVHGRPRQSVGDLKHTVVLSVTWSPDPVS